tara:strand:+ start:1343 stop:3457 length:2115 start_codon:yes stop_codon:yes gene_type:complete
MLKILQNEGYEFEDMSLASELAKKISVSFYTYKNYQHLFTELLAYFSYEATKIIFKIHKSNGKEFLCIMGNDGGLSEDNKKVLKSNQIGKSTGQNISYFGAGARTAARQYTKDCFGNVFGICDSKCEILYSTDGILGLSVMKSDTDIFKKTYGLKIKDGYTCWVLPYVKDKWDPNNAALFKHLTFMYNDRLTTDNENIRLKFKWGQWYKSKISLFNSKDDFAEEKDFEILNEKYHIFECMNNFKVRLLHTRIKKKNEYSPNMNGNCGLSLLITNNGNQEYYNFKRPGVSGNESDYIYDRDCTDWNNYTGKHFNEKFEFSYEVMKLPNTLKDDKNINPRRKIIANKFFNNINTHVEGVRFLMKDKNKKVFVVKDRMEGGEWKERGLGFGTGGMLNIILTKEQYNKYAKPSIRRTDQWNCDNRLRILADNLYNYLASKCNRYIKNKALTIRKKKEEEMDKKRKEREEKWIENYKQDNESIILIQSIWRRKVVPSFNELNKKYKEEVRQEIERLRRRKERHLYLYNNELNNWIKEQKEKMGYLYIRHTKRMRDDGDEWFGNWIIMIGKSKTNKSIDNRQDSYHRADHTPIEDLDEIWNPTKHPVYYFDDAETDWKKRMQRQGYKYKDKLRDEKGKTTKSDELFVCDVKTIFHFRDEAIKCQKDKFESDKKIKEEELMRKFNLKQEDFDNSDSDSDSDSDNDIAEQFV